MKIDKKSIGLLRNMLTWPEDAKILKLVAKMKNI